MSAKPRRKNKTAGSKSSRAAKTAKPASGNAIITRADAAYQAGREDDLCSILEPLALEAERLDTTHKRAYLALLALGSAHINKLIDAEDAAKALLTIDPDSVDARFVLCFVHLSMREYQKALDAGNTYVEQVTASNAQSSYASGMGHRSQVFNMMGVASKESAQIEQATKYYELAIAADPANHLPYLNLATLLAATGKKSEAQQIVEKGVARARQVHELRMMQQAAASLATVSACMIVKNEEELLADCLKSIRDWVDEIIVVDTGSSDRTVEIARSYGAKVYHHPWEGDFSKARNQSLSYATGEWIFIIDADERMYADDVPPLKKLLADNRCDVISINVYNVYGEGDTGVTFLPSTRFFRRRLGLRYDGIVHNVLVYPVDQPILRTGIRLRHLGYGLDKEKMKKKLERSKALLEKQLAATPDNAFALFNYAQLLRGEAAALSEANAEAILRSARKAVELTDPSKVSERHIHLMCLDQIAWTLFQQREYGASERIARQALELKSNYLDSLLLLGHIAAREQKYDLARERYHAYLKAQADYDPTRETDNIIMLHVDSRTSAWYALGMISELSDQPDQARRYYEQIVDKDPGYLKTNAHLGRLALVRNDLTEAEKCYRRQIASQPDSVDAYRHLGQILLLQAKPTDAVGFFNAGLKIAPADSALMLGLGRALGETGDYAQALRWLDQAADIDPENSAVLRERASILFRCGQFSDAAVVYEKLVGKHPADAALRNDFANCCFKLERFDQAEEQYQFALALPDHLVLTWRNLGLCQLRLGRIQDGCSSLARYLDQAPDQLDTVKMLGDIHFSQRNYPESLKFFERYLVSRPDDLHALFALSECYLQMGHRDSAVIGYRRILRLDPSFVRAETRLTELVGGLAVK